MSLEGNRAGELSLEEAKIISIYSITPKTALLSPLAWKFNLTGERQLNHNHESGFIPHTELGLGKALKLNDEFTTYALALTRAEFGAEVEDRTQASGGAEVGLFGNIANAWRLTVATSLLGGRYQASRALNTNPARVKHGVCSNGWLCLRRPPCRS